MSRLIVLSTVFLFLLPSAPILGQEEAEVRSVIEQHYASIHANDLDAVFEDHRPEMTWFPSDGRLMFEPGDMESAERMGASIDYGTADVYMSDFSAQIYEDVAVATFYLTGPRSLAGEANNRTTRVTAVWVREDGEWREAHHHESLLRGEIHP